jgi:hypothetical protein
MSAAPAEEPVALSLAPTGWQVPVAAARLTSLPASCKRRAGSSPGELDLAEGKMRSAQGRLHWVAGGNKLLPSAFPLRLGFSYNPNITFY